jgi:ActD protein
VAKEKQKIYGLMAEFEGPEALLAAARNAHQAGYQKLDAFTPMPVEGLSEAVGFHHTSIPLIVLLSGIAGGLTGFGLQYWVHVVALPLNIGGRPLDSWPSFVPITFELTVLFAAIAAVVAMLALNGLPQPYHPVFNAPGFERASIDGFFLCIQAEDPRFQLENTKQFLMGLQAREVSEIES